MSCGKANRLTVAPQGGLGNRMRVIRSAYILARHAGWEVDVAFAENSECHCRFADLFKPLSLPAGNFRIRPAAFSDAPPSRRNLRLPQLLRRLSYRIQLANFSSPDIAGPMRVLQGRLPAYISTCFEFAGESEPMGRLFRPSPRVESLVGEITSRFGPYTAGFHIRTTDNTRALRHSPYRLFAAAARRELAARPHAVFFLATDSAAIRERFAAEFPGHAVVATGSLSRATTQGMAGAAAEMYALSHCNVIYGSHYSSFSEIAAELGGKKALILQTGETPSHIF